MGQSPGKRLIIPSALSEVGPAVQRIVLEAQARGYPESCVFAIRLALEEAISNAVRHGNRGDAGKTVTVEYRIGPECCRITVADQGRGFDFQHLPDPTADENLDRPNGRGVMLMRAYMSDVHFNKRGNKVILIKRRDCALPERPCGQGDKPRNGESAKP